MKKKHLSIHIQDRDIPAICAALPLMTYPSDSTSDFQIQINALLVDSVMGKLIGKRMTFNENELRIICGSVILAKEVLHGELSLPLSASELQDLRRYAFDYNRLETSFASVYNALCLSQGLPPLE